MFTSYIDYLLEKSVPILREIPSLLFFENAKLSRFVLAPSLRPTRRRHRRFTLDPEDHDWCWTGSDQDEDQSGAAARREEETHFQLNLMPLIEVSSA